MSALVDYVILIRSQPVLEETGGILQEEGQMLCLLQISQVNLHKLWLHMAHYQFFYPRFCYSVMLQDVIFIIQNQ